MRGRPVIVGERRFSSKREAGDYVRGTLYRYATGERVSDEDARFLSDLLSLHPEAEQKIGCGVAFFSVEQNEGSRGFWLTRIDGTRTDWSFLACLTPPTPEAEARAAFRTAIRPQVEEFRTAFLRRTDGPRCPLTGEPLTVGNVHIDHDPPFEYLLDAFLRERGARLSDVKVKPTSDGSTVTELADSGLASEWAEFHRRTAGLRAVSVKANLSILRRGRRD